MESIMSNVLNRTFLSIVSAFSAGMIGFGFWKARPGNQTERKAIEVVISTSVQWRARHARYMSLTDWFSR